MLNCSVLRGWPAALGAPSGSIWSGWPLINSTAFSKSAMAASKLRTVM